MSKMKNWIFGMIACASISGAQARIGDAPGQCDARYGKPIAAREGKREYLIGSIRVSCWFKESKCYAAAYEAANLPFTVIPEFRLDRPLSEEQVMRLLRINAGEWEQIEKAEHTQPFEGRWATKTKTLSATVDAISVTIETWEHLEEGMMKRQPAAIDAAIERMEGKPEQAKEG